MKSIGLSSGDNGLIRCYNMFPSNFENIDEMTAYLEHVQANGFNVVWINPIQLAGSEVFEKINPNTGVSQKLKGSLYAMADATLIDPRFSVVKRDEDGDMVLSKAQAQTLKKYNFDFKGIVKKCKALREDVTFLEGEVARRAKEVQQLEKRAKAKRQLQRVNEIYKENLRELKEKRETYQDLIKAQSKCLRLLDEYAISNFTSRAKKLGITPIFDLVLNHIAKDAPLVKERQDFFSFRDRSFLDVVAFKYNELVALKQSNGFSDSEKRKILAITQEIYEILWQPYIDYYIQKLGFCGARIDCVKKIPLELRETIYTRIKAKVEENNDGISPVLFEEGLFSDVSSEEFAKKVGFAGATHMTGSVYYRQRLWHGGLSDNYSDEDFYKRSLVSKGVVNFTGNHDHYTAAMTVCRNFAFERLQENEALFSAYRSAIAFKEEKANEVGKTISEAARENVKTLYIHSYVTDIVNELNEPDNYNELVNRFGKALRDKILTSVFAGSGGYYMLAGDEWGSLHQPAVFQRENNEEVYPNSYLAIFESEHADLAKNIVIEMVHEYLSHKKENAKLSDLDCENQMRFLSPYIEHVTHELNAREPKTLRKFKDKLEDALKAANYDFSEELLSSVSRRANFQNGWNAPSAMQRFVNVDFISEINHIVSKLSAPEEGYWSELFKAMNENILIAVRMNGHGYSGNVDVVIVNLDPDEPKCIEQMDLEKIAQWLQQRGFPKFNDEVNNNPDYHKSYGCIMGSREWQMKPANLFFAGKIEVAEELLAYSVDINGKKEGFNIVVSPKPLGPDPLFPRAPVAFLQESCPESLLTLFGKLRTSLSSVLTIDTECTNGMSSSSSYSSSQENSYSSEELEVNWSETEEDNASWREVIEDDMFDFESELLKKKPW